MGKDCVEVAEQILQNARLKRDMIFFPDSPSAASASLR